MTSLQVKVARPLQPAGSRPKVADTPKPVMDRPSLDVKVMLVVWLDPTADRYTRRRRGGDDGVVGARGAAFAADSALGARSAPGAAASGAAGVARDACGAVRCAAAAASPRRIHVAARDGEKRGETQEEER